MIIRDLIEVLQEIQDEHGEYVPVRVDGDGFDEIDSVFYAQFHNKVFIEQKETK